MQATQSNSNGFAPPKNPFFLTNNNGYGTNWESTNGHNPIKAEGIPVYSDIVSAFEILKRHRASANSHLKTQSVHTATCCFRSSEKRVN